MMTNDKQDKLNFLLTDLKNYLQFEYFIMMKNVDELFKIYQVEKYLKEDIDGYLHMSNEEIANKLIFNRKLPNEQ